MTMNRRFSSSKRQLGQLSVEFVGVIALVALVLAGIAYYLFVGRIQTKTNTAISALSTSVGGAQRLYNNDPDGYTGVTNQVLIDNKVIPDAMVQGAGTIVSSLGGAVTVTPAGTNDSRIQFAYAAVDDDACSDFVMGVEQWFYTISVNGATVKDVDPTQATPVPLDAATLGTQCSGSNNPAITFIAGR